MTEKEWLTDDKSHLMAKALPGAIAPAVTFGQYGVCLTPTPRPPLLALSSPYRIFAALAAQKTKPSRRAGPAAALSYKRVSPNPRLGERPP